jgi:HK97 family phage major capsid protein
VYGVSRGPVKSLWGVPVVTTSLIPKGVVLTGWFDAQTVQIARRQGVQVQMTNSNESDFISGKITVRADERLGLLCYRPTAFELIHLG